MVDERVSPSVERPINGELYPLTKPYFRSLDVGARDYSPDDGPGAA